MSLRLSWSGSGRRPYGTLVALSLIFPVSFEAGCGPGQGDTTPDTLSVGPLEDVAGVYKASATQLNRPPKSLKDLVGGNGMYPRGQGSIASGNVIIYWGVEPIPDDQPTDEILAYNAKVPTEGGAVLMKNGTVRQMTAAQFQAAPKPADPTSK